MKYTEGGFPFKEIETGTDRVSPVSPSPALAGPEVKQFDVDDRLHPKSSFPATLAGNNARLAAEKALEAKEDAEAK